MIELRHRAALVLAFAWPELAAAETLTATVTSSIADTATSAAEREEDALTTDRRAEGAPGAELALAPLKLPELITELALSPLIPVLLSFEKLRLHERLFDLLTNDERTMAIVPVIDAFNRSGFSAGAGATAGAGSGAAAARAPPSNSVSWGRSFFLFADALDTPTCLP